MSFWSKLFGTNKAKTQAEVAEEMMKLCGITDEPNTTSSLPDVEIRDYRSDSERQIEIDVSEGRSFGPEADALIEELIEIPWFMNRDEPIPEGFREDGRHIRAREIGEELNRIGGMSLMEAAAYRVRAERVQGKVRELEHCWNRIGSWQS